MHLTPLAGESYLYLAHFLRLQGDATFESAALVRQALRVRPHHRETLMAAGAERAAAGDLAAAAQHWQELFRAGPDWQNRLVPLLVENRVPVRVILDRFEPDLDATRLLDAQYTSRLTPEDAQVLLEYYLKTAERVVSAATSDGAAALWAEIESLYERLGQPDVALRCLRRAVAARPSDPALRTALARRLFREHEYAEAEMHFKWRLQRSPDDAEIQAMLTETQRMLKWESATATTPRSTVR